MVELRGKIVFVFFKDFGQSFKYQGELLDITDSIVIIQDRKVGLVILPLAKCGEIREVRDD